jgi:hypothetical protein
LKRRHFSSRHIRIIAAMQRKHSSVDIFSVIRCWRIQPAMKTDGSGKIRAAARKF